ncbi:hypothetical protein DYB37_002018 [Aphanomyces astaci]|uniref:Amino acid permease/ SLC12A domain-containing protein n=1 Tax=Aphanomyces astaci TaxID=112090 RepID=A0A418CJZ3_APHAT|nr:hypothetical protein DYB35_001263 [Aphanomyces astaci]RHZ23595.1 hypothetical protein DYB37_002018 [Aphanomyces astaci]
MTQVNVSSFDIWAVGICVVIGGQYFSWNLGLAAGTLSYGVAVGLMGSAYLCLSLSMAEVTSMVPFAGGAYGLGRCTLGYYVGFILGCCEFLEYIIYVSVSVVTLGDMLTAQWTGLHDAVWVVWFLSYVVGCAAFVHSKVFWMWTRLLVVVSIGLLLLYCVGSMPYLDVTLITQSEFAIIGGGYGFMQASPQAAWLFVGIESLNTLSGGVAHPKATIPKGQVACMLTLLITATWVFVVSIALPPGMPSVSTVLVPLNYGYTKMFGISDDATTMLAVPATFATAQGFMLSYANILDAMANSKLLPPFLAHRHPVHGTPVNALLVGSALSFGLCFVIQTCSLGVIMFNVCMLFGFMAYMAQCVGYIFLKRRHKSMERLFHSPAGIGGAVFAMCVWSLNIVSIVGFQQDDQVGVGIAFGVVALCSVYYQGYAKYHQSYSDEEQKLMFFAHVAKHNQSKRFRIMHMNRSKRYSTTSGYSGTSRTIAVKQQRRTSGGASTAIEAESSKALEATGSDQK